MPMVLALMADRAVGDLVYYNLLSTPGVPESRQFLRQRERQQSVGRDFPPRVRVSHDGLQADAATEGRRGCGSAAVRAHKISALRVSAMRSQSDDDRELLARASAGDAVATGEALNRHRDRLRRMVDARLDRRIRGRVDPSDILQDGMADAVAKLPGYLADPNIPLFIWLRLVVGERLIKAHREHLGTQARDAGREVSLFRGPMPAASSAALAAHLLGRETSPTQAAVRAERLVRLQEALNALDPLDREILSLRHFEELTHAETARVLEIHEAAAAKRYIRALRRLKDVLATPPVRPGERHVGRE